MTFPIRFHPTNAKAAKCIVSNYATLQLDEASGDLFAEKPTVVNRRGRNLKDKLVRSRIKGVQQVDTNKCGRRVCVTCSHICTDKVVVGPSGTFEVKTDFTCESVDVVYCIQCRKCGELYVGETGRKLKDRFREHRNSVAQEQTGKEVAEHFNSDGHSVEDMQVLGLYKARELVFRRLMEQKIIARLGCVLGQGGMNTDFKFQSLLTDGV